MNTLPPIQAYLLLGLLPCVFIGVGVLTLCYIPSAIRKKRKLEETPSSLISSARTGYVELCGRTLPSEAGLITAPFSGQQCVYYEYSISGVSMRGENRRGRNTVPRLFEEEQSDQIFYLKDETGACAVIPFNMNNFLLDKLNRNCYNTRVFSYPVLPESYFKHPDTIKKYGNYHDNDLLPADPLFSIVFYDVVENYIPANENIFVAGCLSSNLISEKDIFKEENLPDQIKNLNKLSNSWIVRKISSITRSHTVSGINESWNKLCEVKKQNEQAGQSEVIKHISGFNLKEDGPFIVSRTSKNEVIKEYTGKIRTSVESVHQTVSA